MYPHQLPHPPQLCKNKLHAECAVMENMKILKFQLIQNMHREAQYGNKARSN